jgi:putative ABC transport system permease protein
MQILWQDLRLVLRRLRNAPGFALVVVLTLALGIGPTTAVYAVFRQVLLRQLPVHKPSELVLLAEHSNYETGSLDTYGGGQSLYFSPPAYRALRAAYGQLAAAAFLPVNFATAQEAFHVDSQLVSGNYFSLLGERPLLGRLLTEDDDRIHAGNPVALLGESFWRSHFAASSNVLNMPVAINGVAFTVVGVIADHGLLDARPAQVFVPKAMRMALSLGRPDTEFDPLYRSLLIVGRVPPGAGRTWIESRLNSAWWNWRRDVLHTHADSISNGAGWMKTNLKLAAGGRGVSELAEELGTPVRVLQGMALLVLLVACANLANLLLSRAATRRGEMALRAALGASRWQRMAGTVSEGLLIGAAGTALGCGLGWSSLRLMVRLLPSNSATAMATAAPFHGPVLLFGVGAGLVTTLLFSLGPALAYARVPPTQVLRRAEGVVSGQGARVRSGMVSLTLALSLLLLLMATLFGWNLYKLSTIDPGFQTARLLTFHIDKSATGATSAATAAMYTDVIEEAKGHAGVQSAAYSLAGLLSGDEHGSNISVEGRPNQESDPEPDQNYVSPGFFHTMEIPLLRGRMFTDADSATSEPVAVVDQAFVRSFFGGDAARALGSRFGMGASNHMQYPIRIVGIVPAIHENSLRSLPQVPFLYLVYSQTYSKTMSRDRAHPATFYMRTAGDPDALAADMRALVHRIDPKVPIQGMETMQQQVADSLSDTRLLAILSSALGLLAAALAAIGLYGVLAYQVATRTREIGLRMAVGASRARIAGLLLGQMLRLTVWGMGAGAVLAWCAARLLHSQMAELSQAPLWLYCAAALLLFLTAVVASLVPAQRAARMDPMQALRTE